jgi:hypothetical protein
MAELIFLTLIGLSCFGIGLKVLIHQCDIKDELEVNLIVTTDNNESDNDNEIPPKYEDI